MSQNESINPKRAGLFERIPPPPPYLGNRMTKIDETRSAYKVTHCKSIYNIICTLLMNQLINYEHM